MGDPSGNGFGYLGSEGVGMGMISEGAEDAGAPPIVYGLAIEVVPDPTSASYGNYVEWRSTLTVSGGDQTALGMRIQIMEYGFGSEPIVLDADGWTPPVEWDLIFDGETPAGWDGTFTRADHPVGSSTIALSHSMGFDPQVAIVGANSAESIDTPSDTDTIAVAAPAWTVDATSGKPTPLTGSEAAALFTAAGATPNVTNLWRMGNHASSPIADVVGGKDLTSGGAENAWSFAQAESGWSLPVLKVEDTRSVFRNTTLPNINATDEVIFVLAKVAASLATRDGFRTLFARGTAFDDDAVVEINTAPRLVCGEGDGTRTVGAASPTGSMQWFALRVTSAGVAVFTGAEKITVGARACNGTNITIGGDNVNQYYAATMSVGLVIRNEGTMTDSQIHSSLGLLQGTPSWTP